MEVANTRSLFRDFIPDRFLFHRLPLLSFIDTLLLLQIVRHPL